MTDRGEAMEREDIRYQTYVQILKAVIRLISVEVPMVSIS